MTMASGAQVQWQFVAQSRPGDNFGHPEEIVEGTPVGPVVIPDLNPGGGIATAGTRLFATDGVLGDKGCGS